MFAIHANLFPDAFEPLQHLRALNLFNNFKLFQTSALSQEPRLSLSGLNHMEVLGFGSNMLSNVPWELLDEVNQSLVSLDLSHNVFIELGYKDLIASTSDDLHYEYNTFPRMPRLQHLNLDSCRIQIIHWKAFTHLSNLTDLSLRRNPLYVVPVAAMLPSLESLYLEGIEGIFDDGDKFVVINHVFSYYANMSNLKVLSMTNMQLGPIGPKTFEGLDGLEDLILDYVVFDSVDEKAFMKLTNL